ncbi:MAG: tannase/feruloyl esterase family alpha/beta hydrolase [Acidobacteria bacterium]|nr:tannase/feruloyl esterase family alpha/beta hydrolase [Acidobacteriota bacterium]
MLAIVAMALSAAPVYSASCESLAQLKLADTTITTATNVAAGSFIPPNAPNSRPIGDLAAFCRVAATLKPSSDSDIRIEVWMPAAGWNGKFMGVGNGGWAGQISYAALVTALKDGYATASTDTGHEGASARFVPGHPEKLVDFAYRAVPEMTVKGKAITAAFYDQSVKRSYWNGCSTGGRQGMKEAQMFPGDYDGIIAGAPASNWVALMTGIVWGAHAAHRNEPGNLTEANLARLHDAVLKACDASDGLKDGVLEDPTRCKFDPKVLECGSEPGCFTPAQVAAVRMMYSGPVNPRTRQMIYPGMVPGSELGWDPAVGLQPLGIAVSHFQYVVFNNPKWAYSQLDYDSDVAQAWKLDTGLITAMDPNLKPFFDRGGKLLQYHGWNDQQISPLNSVNYYNSVLRALGRRASQSSYRLFMQPGVKHCRGGNGTDRFEAVRTLEEWVEQGKTPERILSTHMTGGKVDRSRPMCPYPQVAVYKGSGSTDDAANFVCRLR